MIYVKVSRCSPRDFRAKYARKHLAEQLHLNSNVIPSPNMPAYIHTIPKITSSIILPYPQHPFLNTGKGEHVSAHSPFLILRSTSASWLIAYHSVTNNTSYASVRKRGTVSPFATSTSPQSVSLRAGLTGSPRVHNDMIGL